MFSQQVSESGGYPSSQKLLTIIEMIKQLKQAASKYIGYYKVLMRATVVLKSHTWSLIPQAQLAWDGFGTDL